MFTTRTITSLQKRKQLVRPDWPQFENSPYALYRGLLPPNVNEAIDLLGEACEGKFRGVLTTYHEGRVHLLGPDRGRLADISLNWGVHKPALSASWSGNDALKITDKHPMFASLMDFAQKCGELDRANDETYQLVKYTCNACNTFGQIHRVWPDLLPLVSSAKISKAEGQTRKSNLPDYFDTQRVIAGRDKATLLLAQAAILPDPANGEDKFWAMSVVKPETTGE